MAGSDDDDGFSDEDLDALTAHDFYQLQENAIRSTQAATEAAKATAAISKSFSKPVEQSVDQASSDYGDIDDDLILNEDLLDEQDEGFVEQPAPAATYINQAVPGENTQREQWRQTRYATDRANQAPATNHHWKSFGQRPNLGIPSKQEASPRVQVEPDQDVVMLDSSPPKGDPPALVALQAKFLELLREKETLQQAVTTANENALAKAGEAAILRAKQEKLAREHDQRIAALQKANAENAARQKAELDAARAEAENLAIRNKFLDHEVQEETVRAKQLQKAPKAPKETISSALEIRTRPRPVTAPKKKPVQDHGDGFDDDAFAPLSPSKGKAQKAATPKAGEKRKRKAIDKSPAIPLRLTQPVRADSAFEDEAQFNPLDDGNVKTPVLAVGTKAVVPTPRLLQKEDRRFEFTQKILNYRLGYGEKRCVDRLAKFAYPSDMETSLSSLFYQKLATLNVKQNEEFPASVATIFVGLWVQCIDEKFYPPVSILLSLITYIIALAPLKAAPRLVQDSSLVTIAQLTADINLIPRLKRPPASSLNGEISTVQCLELLSLTVSSCTLFPDAINRFWLSMRFDFILMALHITQPLQDIHLMLQTLETSVLETSFAMIVPPTVGEQSVSEMHVIDRMVLLLNDRPKPAPDQGERYDPIALSTLRLSALTLLEKMSETDYGVAALVANANAIGRLVRMINDEINAIYEFQPGHEISTELVNRGTFLLHYLTMTTHKGEIDMGAKLRAVQGGKDKFMIAMTRLAFCEPVYFERGIEEAAIECAHAMLDEMVDYREAREANEIFGRGG